MTRDATLIVFQIAVDKKTDSWENNGKFIDVRNPHRVLKMRFWPQKAYGFTNLITEISGRLLSKHQFFVE